MAQLSTCGRYIFLTQEKKMLNPSYDASISRYIGPIENYAFKHQKKNYDAIQEKLGENKLTFIYEGKFMGDRRKKTAFIAHNNNLTFWWRKYESKAEGSGQNKVYFVINGNVTELNLKEFISNDLQIQPSLQ